MARPCGVDYGSYLGAIRNYGGNEVQFPNLPGRPRMGDLGKASLQPYTGHLLRLAWECVHRVLLLRRAATDKSSCHQPQARMGHFLAMELRRCPARMDPG